MSGGFFNQFSPWGGSGGGGNQQPGGHQGPSRGGNHPEHRPHGLGGSRRGVSFKDDSNYDLANDGREYGGGRYSHRRGLSDLEYKACCTSIFNPEGYLNNGGQGGGQPMPPAPPAWHGQQGMGLPTAAHPQGPQGLYLNDGGRGGGQPTMPPASPVWQGMQGMGLPNAAHAQGLPGQYGLSATPGPLGGGALAPPAATTPLAPGNQQGGAPLAPGTQQGKAPLAPQAPGTQ
jgi:hypothetical protein